MDFKSLLQSFDTITESTVTTETVHKGKYGTSYQPDEKRDEYGHKIRGAKDDTDDDKEKETKVKKGRGRPSKAAKDSDGKEIKHDTSGIQKMLGDKPKGKVGKTSVKHTLKDWIIEVETNHLMEDAMNTQMIASALSKNIDQMSATEKNKLADFAKQTLGTVTSNPQATDKLDTLLKTTAASQKTISPEAPKTSTGQPTTDPKLKADLDKVKNTLSQISPMKESEKWIQKATNPKTKGDLHKALHVPQDEKIPAGKLEKATHSKNPHVRHMAQFAKNIRKEDISETDLDESGLQYYTGKKKYGKDGMAALAKAGREGANQQELGKIKDKFIKKEDISLNEKAVSQAQQKFMGMVHAAQKGEKAASPEVAKVAKTMSKKAAHDFAATKHKGLPQHVKESVQLNEAAMKDLVTDFIEGLRVNRQGYSIIPAVNLGDIKLAKRVIRNTLAHDSKYKNLSHTLKNQLEDYALEEFGFTEYDRSLEEADITHDSSDSIKMHTSHEVEPTRHFSEPGSPMAVAKGTPTKINKPEATAWSTDPIQATTDRAYNFISSLGKGKKFTTESKDMKDIQLESWESQLNELLNEGITVSSSTGQQNQPDSVSVNATDADAEKLLAALRQAGVGVFGGEERTVSPSAYGAPEHEEELGQGTETPMSPTVVGDGDDMLALIKKMSGISSQKEPEGTMTVDFEKEEGEGDEGHEETCDGCGHEMSDCTCDDEKEETDEGNAFTAKLKDTPKGGEFELDGKKYKDTSNLEETEEKCNECGMYESECGCDHMDEAEEVCDECGMYESKCECEHEHVEESYANSDDDKAMQDLQYMLQTLSGGLNKPKHSQATGNITKVTMEDTLLKDSASLLTDWQKLSGIK